MAAKTTRIVIVDDHLLIAKAIHTIIDSFDGYEVLFECENGRVLQERLNQSAILPDLIILDISMPELDGFATAEWLQSHYPSILIMALTMRQDDHALVEMIRLGASGYINKNVHPNELHTALQQILTKGFYYPEWASGRLLQQLAKGTFSPANQMHLSDREREFLQYVCTELTYKEIGDQMHCSGRTVEGYRDSLFEKLGVKTRVALAMYAVKNGLVTI